MVKLNKLIKLVFLYRIQSSSPCKSSARPTKCGEFKVTVRFETEGNGQNEIVSHMDRSEVKL